jgi:hypothetical protein
MSRRNYKEAYPRGIVVTGGVRSPSHHHVHTGDWRELFKLCLRLTSGPGSISYFQRFSITQILKFESVCFPVSKILKILQVNSIKHTDQLYFLAQLQISSGLQVTNSGINSNLNFP